MVLANTGCMQEKAMDDAAINMKADSILQFEKRHGHGFMMKDCETNMSAWVQMKADSIYNAESTNP